MLAGIWKHTQTGGYCQVLAVARYADGPMEGEECVVYVSLGGLHLPGSRVAVRSKKEWESHSTDNPARSRFIWIGDSIPESELPQVESSLTDAARSIGSQLNFRRKG